jgi:hypothetical protein
MVLDSIQQHVVEHFGYSHVNALRTAVSRFPDDPIIKEAFYSKEKKRTIHFIIHINFIVFS